MKKKLIFLFQIIFIYIIFVSISFADLQKKLINKITATKTLSFNFKQKIAEKVEFGNCYIKYPLLMKCIYQNLKQKSVISNGRTVAIIKKKYKKIYYYPIKTTPLFIILKKEKILHVIRNNKPTKIDSSIIEFELIEKKASTSFLQRKLQIGYNRAARIMEMMEKEGIVGQANHVGKREIL